MDSDKEENPSIDLGSVLQQLGSSVSPLDNSWITTGIDMSSVGVNTVSITPSYTFANSGLTTSTISAAGTGGWNTQVSPALTVGNSGMLSLVGDKADIEINGVSLCETLKSLEQRLNILRPNPSLETDWDDLKKLGEQYRELENKILEKQKMWDILKKMPPPDLS
jgi:hypothetical protein